MNPATTQMNVRIPIGTKRAGDAALASLGLTPSAAVRILWEKAAQRGESLSEVASLLVPKKREQASNDPALAGASIVSRAMSSLGFELDEVNVPTLSDDELIELALSERLSERGIDE